jgi:hypothetical protein
VKFTGTLITALAAATILITGGTGRPAQAQSGFEKEPVLNAKDLVSPELLKGPYFTVDDAVPVKGLLARFTIRSPYGKFDAHGIHMLTVRVTEVHAIGKLDELSKTKEFAEAAGKAIARPVTSTVNMLIHPVDTITGFPDGVSRLFGRIDLGFKSVEQAATSPGQSGGQRAEEASKRVGSVTLTALGWEKERRDLAKSLGVDPYTTNLVLSEKLTSAAWVAFSGRFVIQTATSILVPYSMAMSAMTITNSTIYDTPAGDLVNNATAVFKSTGATDAQVQALVQNPQYSLSVLTALAQGIQRLKDVPGRDAVVGFSAAAATQDETRFLAAAMNMLARHHESVAPIVEVSAPHPVVGRTAAGVLLLPLPVDYVAWTQNVARHAEAPGLKAPDRSVSVSGQVSPRARKELTTIGWKVNEVFSIAAER